jgi:hypothetical protein
LFVGDAGMYSADNLAQLSRGLGRYILAVPMRRLRDIEDGICSSRLNDRFPVQDSADRLIRIDPPSCCCANDGSKACE